MNSIIDEISFDGIISKYSQGIEQVFSRKKRLFFEKDIMLKIEGICNQAELSRADVLIIITCLAEAYCMSFFFNYYKFAPKKYPRWDEKTLREKIHLCCLSDEDGQTVLERCLHQPVNETRNTTNGFIA